VIVVERCICAGKFCCCQFLGFWEMGSEGLLFNAFSATKSRSSRPSCSLDIDSLIRAMASLSGWMLKFPIVAPMSCDN
jgi:hypothetical protein